MANLIVSLGLLLLAGAPRHDTTVSFGRLAWEQDALGLELRFDADRLLQTAAFDHPDGTAWTEPQIQAAREPIEAYLRTHYSVLAGDAPIARRLVEYEGIEQLDPFLGEPRLTQLRLRYELSPPPGDFELTVRHELFVESEVGHPHALSIEWPPDEPFQQDLYVQQSLTLPWEDPTVAGRWRRVQRYAMAGLRNTLWNPVLLLFLPLALMGLRSRRAMVWVAACFLIGRTVPYWLVGLQQLAPSAAAVHTALWLSLAYVAVEAWWSRDPRMRWATGLLLGIVFGLALGLAFERYGTPEHTRAPCVLAYQLGAEVAFGLSLWIAVVIATRFRRERAAAPATPRAPREAPSAPPTARRDESPRHTG